MHTMPTSEREGAREREREHVLRTACVEVGFRC